MKHLTVTALSVLAALGLSAGALAQDDPAAAPQPLGEQTEGLDVGAAGEESLDSWDAERLSELGGETLFNDQGDSLGEIQEFVRSTEDDRIYAVVSSEEALEIDTMTTVGVDMISQRDGDLIYTGDAQELQRMFDEEPYQEASYQPLDEEADERV